MLSANLFGVSVFVLFEVVGDAAVEGLEAEEVCHHSNDGRPLPVGNAVKDFIDLIRVIDGY